MCLGFSAVRAVDVGAARERVLLSRSGLRCPGLFMDQAGRGSRRPRVLTLRVAELAKAQRARRKLWASHAAGCFSVFGRAAPVAALGRVSAPRTRVSRWVASGLTAVLRLRLHQAGSSLPSCPRQLCRGSACLPGS